jgi:2-C-methyl-D-erythritol 2,4-cyclodiphosphate synthase
MRVGIGYDIHRLAKGRRLVLGGVEISHDRGLEGHSDADVVLHAVSDAILGAAGLGDIGTHFPDTDARFKDISSMTLLEKVCALALEGGYRIGNIDVVVVAEKPVLGPYVAKMKESISETLRTGTVAVSIKATTNEGVGPVGRGEAIASFAVATLEEEKDGHTRGRDT